MSRHPVAAHAVGEVVGEVLERIGLGADLIVVFATGPMTGALDDTVRAIRDLLLPRHIVGTTAYGVLAGSVGIEESAAISIWAARFVACDDVVAMHLTTSTISELMYVTEADDERWAIVLADPFTFAVDELVERTARERPNLRFIGGLASAAHGPGGNRIVVDHRILTDGAAVALLPRGVRPTTIVSQGCRPIGQPFTVTRSERNIVYELAGRPALDRLTEIVDGLDPADRKLAAAGLHCGIVIDEHLTDFGRGDFLVRAVLGGDKNLRAIAIGDHVGVGTTVQFHVRDAGTAGGDLATLTSGVVGDGALLFTCTGRGAAMFGSSDHDVAIIDEALTTSTAARPAVAGMFCAGEIGPVGSRNALHAFTASLVAFTD